MSDTTESTANAGEQAGEAQEAAFTPITTQADLDRIITKRLDRERAKFSDYEDLKAAQSQLTEAQGRITELESETTSLAAQVQEFEDARQRAQLAREVAEEVGVPADALRGSTKDELLAHATQLKALIPPPTGPVVRRQADTPGSPPADPNLEAVRNLFGQ